MTLTMPIPTLCQLVAILLLAGCVATPQSAPPSEPLIAESIGLVTPTISAALSQQAQSGVNSAIHVVGQHALRASGYRRAFNSSYVAANFPLAAQTLSQYNASLSASLAASAYGAALTHAANSQLAAYSLLSWQPLDEQFAMLELVVGISDWQQAQARVKAQPEGDKRTGQAFVESSLWFSLHRKVVPRSLLAGSAEALLPLLAEMSEQSVRLLPSPGGK